MGCFSWHKVDTGYNVQEDKGFKLLIPKEFADKAGFDYIKDESYQSYGYLSTKPDGSPKYDIYELIALWNAPNQCRFTNGYLPIKEIDEHTSHNRSIGIDIGCYDKQMAQLKYPLRLINFYNNDKYEDFEGLMSINDENQGWGPNCANIDSLSIERAINEKISEDRYYGTLFY